MSLSLEATKYRGDNTVVIREFVLDGEIIPIFKITEEELDFKGGRFKRYVYSLKLPVKKVVLGVDPNQTNIKEIIEWIENNTEGFWNFDISDDLIDSKVNGDYYWKVWIFRFKNEEDYVKFVLRWM